MTLIRTISRHIRKDTAVYWGTPTRNVYGALTYPDPIEINCYWVDVMKLVKDKDGVEVMSESTVYVLEDLVLDGVLFHGTLEDIEESGESDYPQPKDVQGSHKIIRFEKTASLLRSSEYLKIAYV